MLSLLADLSLNPGELAGRVALVTGAGRGIGREVARALAALGASVVIAELSPTGREVEQAIRAEGGRALFIQTDVSSPESIAALAASSLEAFGPVDILVNNAIRIAAAPLVDLDLATWDSILDVNLRGAFLTVKAFLPAMLAAGQGIIVNMVSTEAMPGLSAYIASKQGLVGFSHSLASEVGMQGVKVIAFAPGMVDTSGIRSVAQDLSPHLGLTPEQFLNVSLHPAYEGLMPAEHAGLATAYLVARQADTCHGETVTGYEILERAGFITIPQVAAPPDLLPTPSTVDWVNLVRQFYAGLADTTAEFDQLPIFIRPLARAGFKSKAGLSLQDWQREAGSLLQAAESADNVAMRSSLARLTPLLDRLVDYYQGVPAETARFSKDQAFLDEVTARINARIAAVRALQRHVDS